MTEHRKRLKARLGAASRFKEDKTSVFTADLRAILGDLDEANRRAHLGLDKGRGSDGVSC